MIFEIKKSLDRFNNSLDTAEVSNSELKWKNIVRKTFYWNTMREKEF